MLVPVILCLAVWLVYTLDHLSDAYYLGSTALKPVYIWHWKRRRVLLGLCAGFAAAAVLLSILYLPAGILYAGLAGSGFLLAYMLVHSMPFKRKKYYFKEFWVGGIYTLGVWGLPLIFRHKDIEPVHLLIMASFFCLVMVNVLSYSLFELPIDRREHLPTLAVRYGPRLCRNLIVGFLVLAVVSCLSSMLVNPTGKDVQAGCILLLMCQMLGMVHLFPDYFERNGRFGILADAVFLLPGVIILF